MRCEEINISGSFFRNKVSCRVVTWHEDWRKRMLIFSLGDDSSPTTLTLTVRLVELDVAMGL